jgi:hypothetical protein
MLHQAGIIPISIAQFSPRWFNGLQYKALAPYANMLKMDRGKYEPLFYKILSALDPNTVLKELESLAGGKPFALLCYEKECDTVEQWCHRSMVALWFINAGYEVEEFQPEIPETVELPKEKKKEDPQIGIDFGV